MNIIEFVTESNKIEGINREPTPEELAATIIFLRQDKIRIENLCLLVQAYQPGAFIRSTHGMNVTVGKHVPPPGGPHVVDKLNEILFNLKNENPWVTHNKYETLHPFMDGNGRSGRALWLWQMGGIQNVPLGFLHTFYYQTLQEYRA